MLFKPPAPEPALRGIHALLDSWNAEADYFRSVAVAARHGEPPASYLVDAAEEAQQGLEMLLDEIDNALDALPPGHPDFPALLHAQVAAVALRESIGHSLDVLERFVALPAPGPVRIAHTRSPSHLAQ
jgi:hypothetical protein